MNKKYLSRKQFKRLKELRKMEKLTPLEKSELNGLWKVYDNNRDAARFNRECDAVLWATFGKDISLAYTQYANDWRK